MKINTTARFAGLLYLLIAVFGGFAFFAGYESLMETGDATTTTNNILNSEFIEEGKSILDENRLFKKIENYKQKWKSKNYIRQKLIERSEDKILVEKFLDEIFYENDEFENLKKEYEKIHKRYDRNKIIQKLLVKWFRYDDIKKVK